MIRALHRLYANFYGYFWLPCPVCGRMFGGHEWRPGSPSLLTPDGHSKGICPRIGCAFECNELNRQFANQRNASPSKPTGATQCPTA